MERLKMFGRFAALAVAGLLMVGCRADGGAQPPFFVADPPNVSPGQSTTLTWDFPGATACTASGPAGTSDFTGSKPPQGSATVTPPSTPGVYTYTLTCTDGNGGTQTGSVDVTVGNAGASGCIDPITSGATVTKSISSTCLICSIDNEGNVIDNDATNFALFNITAGLLGGSGEITVKGPTGVTYPMGNIAGFTLSIPAALLSAQVLPSLTVNTFLNGAPSESVAFSSVLKADLLALLGNDAQFFIGLKTTKNFDAVQLVDNATLANVLQQVRVFNACSNASGVGALPASVLPLP